MSAPALELEDWLAPLVPRFLANRARDVETLRACVAAGDVGEVRFLGHKMRGAAAGYGFQVIAEIAVRLEEAAEAGDWKAIAVCADELDQYLGAVKVVYRPAGA